jgi:(aminoalkyl)phosphonate N-acetyltransferase
MKQAQPIVRRAVVKDCKWIYKFICDLEETEFEYSNFEDLYIRNITNPENIYLVAEVEGLISGFISCHGQTLLHHGGRVFEIQELYVKEEFRDKGIGQLLIKNLESELSKLDYKSLEVTANRKRTKTHDFYRKMGFEFTHLKFTKDKS